MRCPNCQVEVQDWHFYCQNCHVQIQGYSRETDKPARGRIEKAGARVINALVGTLIIIVLVLTARAVQWKEIYAAIHGDAAALAKSDTVSEVKRTLRAKSDAGRPEGKVSTQSKTSEGQKGKKDAAVEREKSQKVEELPPGAGQTQTQKVALMAKPLHVDNVITPKAADPAAKSALPASDTPKPGVGEMNAKNGAGGGLVTITSDVPAKVYINGQFSGTTPRSVKMNPGDLQIRLIADGYEDWSRRVKLKTSQQLGITASMKKKSAQ
jgi:hypothetical protein